MAEWSLFNDEVHIRDKGNIVGGSNDDSRCDFEKLLAKLLHEICGFDYFQSFPAMLGNGQPIDLYKLFLVVRRKGGYDVVCDRKLWDMVGEMSSLGVNVGPSVKLVYSKYLSVLDSWLKNMVEIKVFPGCGLVDDRKILRKRLMELQVLSSDCIEDEMVARGEIKHGIGDDNLDTKLCGGDNYGDTFDCKRKKKKYMLNSSNGDSDSLNCKRMKESALDMLRWVTSVAKNPNDPKVGLILEKSKSKSCINQEGWKKVLLFREAAFLKTFETSNKQYWQNQKIHPYFYEDHIGTNYNLKERFKHDKKLLFGKSTSSARSTSNPFLGTNNKTSGPHTKDRSKKRSLNSSCVNLGIDKCAIVHIPLGENHQAEVPEWIGVTFESDSKWLGTQMWPLVTENTNLIEMDPIGMGRQDSCNCSVPGSVECVRFHISEKREKNFMELGATFFDWNFDQVGEDVKLLWTKKEEETFEDVVRSNPSSAKTYFWDHIFRAFPLKSREDLVSYYFNVFILQRRAYQNRHTLDNIDSDDDGETRALRNAFGHRTQNSTH
ncbi:hypothetical protein VNO78_25231 [Psophocarpus tetragonolobus]|uniref:ARID domain-containing protein n=1 Tax=Psophocarpus tetragonolobus TaxID=3891 RepID=A0AAN9S951_PSOTE